MAAQGGISGVAVGMATAGAFLVYIGIQGVGIRDGLKAVTGGKLPGAQPRGSGATEAAEGALAGAAGRAVGEVGGDLIGDAARQVAGGAPKLVAAARSYLGVRYVLGGMSRSGIDCSALVVRAFQAAYGVTPPRTTQIQVAWKQLLPVHRSLMSPGDLCFWPLIGPPSHVAIATGPGTVIHAPRPGKVVEEVPVGHAFTANMAPRVYRYKGAAK